MRPYTEFGLSAFIMMNQKRVTFKTIANHLLISPQYVSDIFTGKAGDGKKVKEREKQIAEFLGMNGGDVNAISN